MDNLLTIITPLLVAVVAIALFTLSRKGVKRKREQLNRCSFVVRSSYFWGVIMIIIESILLGLLVFGNIDPGFPLGTNIIFIILFIAFGYGIVQAFREKVFVNGDDIIYTPAFGKSTHITFKEIERLEVKRTGVYVYANGKKAFVLDPSSTAAPLFIEIYKTREQ